MTRISSEDAVSISPSPAHPLPLDDGLFFSVKRMEVDPALMWTTQSCLDDEGPFIVFNEILCCGLHMMWRARTVYTIFGIPGISSSVAATEKNHRFAFNFIGDQTYQGVCFQYTNIHMMAHAIYTPIYEDPCTHIHMHPYPCIWGLHTPAR